MIAKQSDTQVANRGRPTGEAGRDVALCLLAAAEQTLAVKGHSEITLREIAALAGTNEAMISYYYDCKNGLISTVIENVLRNIARDLSEFERNVPTLSGCPIRALVSLLVKDFIGSAVACRVVLSELSNFRSVIRKRYIGRNRSNYSRIYSIVEKYVELEIFRDDTDVAQATFTLMCFITGPVAISPIISVFEKSMADLDSDQWIDHITAMIKLQYGAA